MPGVVRLGDVWDALEQAKLSPSGAALGTAYFTKPGALALPNRGFHDRGVPTSESLSTLKTWGLQPVPSGKYGVRPVRRLPKVPLLSMADWSDPGTTVISGVDAIAIYLGGWTPHVWTSTQIAAQKVAPMLPIWVYSPNRPGSANGTADGNSAVKALQALGIPTGVRVAVDMEAVVDAAYVSAFRGVIAAAGYWTTIYGSASAVFGNWSISSGPGGGWWVADWTGSPHLYAHTGVWATQWCNGGSLCPTPWDTSAVVSLDHLWPHISATFALTTTATDSLTGQSASKSASYTIV